MFPYLWSLLVVTQAQGHNGKEAGIKSSAWKAETE